MMKISLERLNALRGIKTTKPSAQPNKNPDDYSPPVNTDNSVNATPSMPAKPNNSEQVEIPCKNYADEDGHFAYIDARTDKIVHVNLNNGKVYTQDEVKQLSLKYAVRELGTDYQTLKWQDVVNENTSYDQFGSPIFNQGEIEIAMQNKKTGVVNGTSSENEVEMDPWGLPL